MFTECAIFTTAVNMDELVNTRAAILREVQGSGIDIRFEDDYAHITGPQGASSFRLARLYRPSSDDVEREAGEGVLLIINAATQKAAKAAARHNHILVPEGGYRIVAPGIALIHHSKLTTEAPRQARLSGRTGVIAETLLLGGKREWPVRELASAAKVSTGLAHRVMARLEREGLLSSMGSGPEKSRVLSNAKALAELWSQEERVPKPTLRGFLYAPSTEALARKILDECPEGAAGGVFAANLYNPVLTRVQPPLRIWVPTTFELDRFQGIGFQTTDEGANVEFTQCKEDPWQVYMNHEEIPRVSKWRAWLEIANTGGRTQELADALLAEL